MPHDAKIIRYQASADLSQLYAVLEAAGCAFEWVMGELAWHDGYWEPAEDALPGVFVEPYNQALFQRPGMEHLTEALVAGPQAQAQVAAKKDGFRLALVCEEGADCTPAAPWSESGEAEVRPRDTRSIFIQNPNVFGYAQARGTFNSSVFNSLQQHGASVREYFDNEGHLVAWRFLVKGREFA